MKEIVECLFVSDLKEIFAKNADVKFNSEVEKKLSTLTDDTLIIAKYTIASPITYTSVEEAENILDNTIKL